MSELFDQARWIQVIQEPDWYITLQPELAKLKERWEQALELEANELKRTVRTFFADALSTGRIALAQDGPDFDSQR